MDEGMLFEQIANAVERADTEEVRRLVRQAVDAGMDPAATAEQGLALGLRRNGDKWSLGEIFLPELVCSAESMKAGMALIEPVLAEPSSPQGRLGSAVIGTVQGDIHDIGKSLVATMLAASGFKVIDLGKDVPVSIFIETAKKTSARLICLSALLTTTMIRQAELVKALKKEGSRDRFIVLCGGCPVTQDWVDSIEADGTAPDAVSAARLARSLVEKT